MRIPIIYLLHRRTIFVCVSVAAIIFLPLSIRPCSIIIIGLYTFFFKWKRNGGNNWTSKTQQRYLPLCSKWNWFDINIQTTYIKASPLRTIHKTKTFRIGYRLITLNQRRLRSFRRMSKALWFHIISRTTATNLSSGCQGRIKNKCPSGALST